jgi:hypothetical protein
VAPENAPKPGTIYVNAQSEEQMPVRDKVIAIAKAKISAVGR